MLSHTRDFEISKKKKKHLQWRLEVAEFSFGSFDLLIMKNGSAAEMGSGEVLFYPYRCPQPIH